MTDETVPVVQADRDAANKAFDIAFRGDTDGIDDAMAGLFARHRLTEMVERDDRYTPYKSLGDCETAAIRAVRLLEEAEDFNANCEECEGEGVPELCGKCFPLFDAARVERRLVMQSLGVLSAQANAGMVTQPSVRTPPNQSAASGLMGKLAVRPFRVAVSGYGESVVYAASRGKALADVWRCDVFNDQPFGYFLKHARARAAGPTYERFGEVITVLGEPAFLVGANKQYVQFVRPGSDVILNAHPFDVIDGNGEDWPYWAPRPARSNDGGSQ